MSISIFLVVSIKGALAASAPIYLTAGLSPSTLFFEDVTNDFKKEDGCEPLIRQAFAAMDAAYSKGDYATLSEKFQLCKPISDPAGYRHLLLWMRNAFTIMVFKLFLKKPFNFQLKSNIYLNQPLKYPLPSIDRLWSIIHIKHRFWEIYLPGRFTTHVNI
jgi:hypothetical protein